MPEPSPTSSWKLDRKVWAGGLTSIVTWAIVTGLHKYAHLDLDAGTIALIPIGLGYIVSYLLPPSVRDIVSRVNNQIVQIANADPNNPTTAKPISESEAKVVAQNDIATGAVPVHMLSEDPTSG